MKTKERKLDHLRICVEEKVECGSSGFEEYVLKHKALPEVNFDKIEMRTEFLGKKLMYPIIMEAMTGGVPKAGEINRDLAIVAEEYGIGFGVGSQRAAIENERLSDTFRVRDVAPNAFVIANIGAVQLNYGYGLKECMKAVEMTGADALALHVNPLQEAVQAEGDRDFSNLTSKINQIAEKLETPVIVKETGCGISREVASNLKVAAIDVGGVGGTSWSLVESFRSEGKLSAVGRSFAGWGIPTAHAVADIAELDVPIIASGGMRSGIEAAKAIALGADCVGVALPLLLAYQKGGTGAVKEYLDQFIYELRVAMFLTGSKTVASLRGKAKRL